MTIANSDLPLPQTCVNKGLIDFDRFGPIGLVVIQPTSFCNLDCDYCYLPDRQSKNRLSLDLIEPIFTTLFTSPFLAQCFTICWHAGEPLAAPISFYESAFAMIEETRRKLKIDCQFRHSLQTNGTLINQAWCDFFQRHSVRVGISIDGPAFIHDAHRRTRRGTGSHAGTMRGISYLQKNNISFSIIAVLTQDSLNYPDEIFQFFLENGIVDIGFNMEETEGVHAHSSLDQAGTEERYRAFMQRFWDLTTQSGSALKVREFECICSLIYRGDRVHHTEMNTPFGIVSIDHQGNFSTFDPELLAVKTDRYGDFVLGNVLRDSFESVCYTDKFQRIYQEMTAGVQQCQESCAYFGACGGGAGSNKYWENGSFNSTETKACRYRIQIITDIVLAGLEQSLGLNH